MQYRNHVRKFFRALPTKWRPKVTAIEEFKDLSTLPLDELISNLKVYEVVLEKDSEISKNKKEKYKSLALKARKVLSEEEASSLDSEDEEYAMDVRDFKKFFRRKGKFVRQPHDDKKSFRKIKEDKKEKEDRSDSEDDSKKEEICLMALDNNKEFDNEVQFGAFCDANVITHNFSAPRTPQSKGVVERKNCTLQEMSRAMLNEQLITQKFWCNAVDTSTYIFNRILIRPFLGKTPYKLFKGKKPSLEYFKVFGSKCFILNTKDYLTKFDPKSTEGIFLGYSPNSKTYVILNKETMRVEESLNVRFNESPPPKSSPLVDDDILEKPKNVKEAIQDKTWTMAMQEELNQFKTNDVWSLVPPPDNQTIIGIGVGTIIYADFDHAGYYVDRKSTSGVCTFMGCCLTLWFSKKQTALDISTIEAKYVSAGKACQQALWMKQALVDYNIVLDDIPVLCDNKGAIDQSKNPVLHSRTKHIEIRHHFLRDNV
ncbi:retrovirus-related pol polyprotein from transposon TNT 1-94 [Tanacetum coccineum]